MVEERITVDSDILAGKPIINGTRISVEFIMELLSSGMNPDDILEEYPHLEREDLTAAFRYATQSLRHEKVYPSPDVAET